MSVEESAIETYCGLCERIINPPFACSKIYSLEDAPTLPVCSTCLAYIEKVGEIIAQGTIKWGELSPIGEKWIKSSGIREYIQKNEGSIDTYAKIPISSADEEAIFKDVMMGRTDPEIFEWEYHELLKRVMKESYREDLSTVLKAYCSRNPNIGYCQGMSYVCMWLLVFLDKNSAFWTLSYLIEKWLLPDFYIGNKGGNSLNGFYVESTTIAGILENCIPFMGQACMPASNFSDFFSLQLLIQLFVNAVDLETCIFLWDKLMQEGSIALIRGVTTLVSISEKYVKKGDHPLNILKTLPEKRIKPQLAEEYERLKVEITAKRVDTLRSLAREHRAREWQKCEKLALKKLQKCSNFDENEIRELRDIFMELISKPEENKEKARYTVKLPRHIQESLEKNEYEAGITKSQFIELVSCMNPNLQASADLIFDRFDEDKSGFLDFRELTICISIMCKGDFDDKLKICFDAYDEDKSGFLQPNEMEAMIESLIKPYRKGEGDEQSLDVEDIKNRMKTICEKSGDILCFRDFLLAVKADPFLFACFTDHFNIVGTDGIQTMKKTTSMKKTESLKRSTSDSMGTSSCRNCLIF